MGWRRVSKQRHLCRPLIAKLAPNFAIHGGQTGIRAACARIFLRSNMLNDKQKDIVLIKQRTKGAAAKKRIQQQAYNFHFASSLTSSVD